MTLMMPQHPEATHTRIGPLVTPAMLAEAGEPIGAWRPLRKRHGFIAAICALLLAKRAPSKKAACTDVDNTRTADDGIDHDRFARGEVRTPAGHTYRDYAEFAEAMERWRQGREVNEANVAFAELAERDQIQPESVTMNANGTFVGMTREEWAAAATCPDWCVADHNEHDGNDARSHAGDWTSHTLTTDDGVGSDGYEPTIVTQMVTGGHRYEPVIQFDTDTGRTFFEMTLDEAYTLALLLFDMVKDGKVATQALGEPCDHAWPIVETGNAGKPGDCRHCGLPYAQRGPTKAPAPTAQPDTHVVDANAGEMWGGEN